MILKRDRQQPGVAFWATVVVVLALLYVASVGPAFWIDRWVTGPGLFNAACQIVYAPLRVAYRVGPQVFRDALDSYAHLWRID
jgi:hypothetical protein